MIVEKAITCPYCWQVIELAFDTSVPAQEYVEDCSVCCRPITIRYEAADGEVLALEVSAELE